MKTLWRYVVDKVNTANERQLTRWVIVILVLVGIEIATFLYLAWLLTLRIRP